MTDHRDIVAEAKADLLGRGVDLSGPCGAVQITIAVAWHPDVKAEGWGLVHSSPPGNGCAVGSDRYRVDSLMQRDGTTIDILDRSESDEGDITNPAAYNKPCWNPTGPQPPGNWRPPIPPAGGTVPLPPTPPTQPPTTPEGFDCATELALLRETIDAQSLELAQVRAGLEQLAGATFEGTLTARWLPAGTIKLRLVLP